MSSLSAAWKNDSLWLDSMYNNRANVPHAEDILADWKRRSAALRAQLGQDKRAILDIAYANLPTEKLDLLLPKTSATKTPFPLMLYIHGGYWSALSKSDHSFVAETLIQQGIAVAVIDYTLCPNATICQIVDECARAIAWLSAHAANYGCDPQRIVLCGHSAGGHLAAMMLAMDWQKTYGTATPLPFRQAIALSGLFDLEPLRLTPFLKTLHLTPESAHANSPVHQKPAPTACLKVYFGAAESSEFARQSQLIKEAWGKTCVPVCESLAGLNHFGIVDTLTQPQSPIWQSLIAALHA